VLQVSLDTASQTAALMHVRTSLGLVRTSLGLVSTSLGLVRTSLGLACAHTNMLLLCSRFMHCPMNCVQEYITYTLFDKAYC